MVDYYDLVKQLFSIIV